MKTIKFRAWDKFNEDMFYSENFTFLSAFFLEVEKREAGGNPIIVMDSVELTDKDGKELYVDDLVNVFYTSNNGEHTHDILYKIRMDSSIGVSLAFVKLLWESFGYNQYPTSTTLSIEYNNLGTDPYKDNALVIKDTYNESNLLRHRWKGNDRSNYIKFMGNLFQNLELLDIK